MAYEKIEATDRDFMEAEWYLLGLALGKAPQEISEKATKILEISFLLKDGKLNPPGRDEAEQCVRVFKIKFELASALRAISSPTSTDEDVINSIEKIAGILKQADRSGVKKSDPIKGMDTAGGPDSSYVRQEKNEGLTRLGRLASIMTMNKGRAN